jgi:hypothetical protein
VVFIPFLQGWCVREPKSCNFGWNRGVPGSLSPLGFYLQIGAFPAFPHLSNSLRQKFVRQKCACSLVFFRVGFLLQDKLGGAASLDRRPYLTSSYRVSSSPRHFCMLWLPIVQQIRRILPVLFGHLTLQVPNQSFLFLFFLFSFPMLFNCHSV